MYYLKYQSNCFFDCIFWKIAKVIVVQDFLGQRPSAFDTRYFVIMKCTSARSGIIVQRLWRPWLWTGCHVKWNVIQIQSFFVCSISLFLFLFFLFSSHNIWIGHYETDALFAWKETKGKAPCLTGECFFSNCLCLSEKGEMKRKFTQKKMYR